ERSACPWFIRCFPTVSWIAALRRLVDVSAARAMVRKHTILFLAANPSGTDSLALEQEARAIQVELERSRYRDSFEVVQRLGAEPMNLLRELRKLKPTVVQFSGHGGQHLDGTSSFGPPPTR